MSVSKYSKPFPLASQPLDKDKLSYSSLTSTKSKDGNHEIQRGRRLYEGKPLRVVTPYLNAKFGVNINRKTDGSLDYTLPLECPGVDERSYDKRKAQYFENCEILDRSLFSHAMANRSGFVGASQMGDSLLWEERFNPMHKIKRDKETMQLSKYPPVFKPTLSLGRDGKFDTDFYIKGQREKLTDVTVHNIQNYIEKYDQVSVVADIDSIWANSKGFGAKAWVYQVSIQKMDKGDDHFLGEEYEGVGDPETDVDNTSALIVNDGVADNDTFPASDEVDPE